MHSAPELTRVRDAHRIDSAALAAYLEDHLPGFSGSLSLHQFEGGQSNPTYLLSAGGREWVLRKKPPGPLLRSAHQVEREYRVIRALRGSEVPVPRALLLCDDASVIGTPFYVMQRALGRLVTDPALPGFSPSERAAIYADLVRVLAALHRVEPEAVGLGDFGAAGDYCARQISRWSRQYAASKTEEIPEMDALIGWLAERRPASDETCVVHGDYRLGNCMLHPEEPRVLALLDWELSTLGHPLADLAHWCQSYRGATAPGETLAGTVLADAGIPSEAELLARYCAETGRASIDDWPYFMVLVMFRSAAILQGVYRRGLEGNASSRRARECGALARECAREAWHLAQGA
jgi:aminoglycoside phosphotransferase (APT) family kinase protein